MTNLYNAMNESNTALLVIDIINSCAHERCELPELKISFSKIRRMVPRLQSFLEKFRQKSNIPIIFCKTMPWHKKFLPENINILYTDPKARYYSADTSGFPEEFYTVTPQSKDRIITKNHYDAFTNPELTTYLEEAGIQYILIAGIFGDGCVLATICGGFSRGYNFVILEDLIETTDVPVRQELLNNLKQFTWPVMYGKTITSAEFLQATDGR